MARAGGLCLRLCLPRGRRLWGSRPPARPAGPPHGEHRTGVIAGPGPGASGRLDPRPGPPPSGPGAAALSDLPLPPPPPPEEEEGGRVAPTAEVRGGCLGRSRGVAVLVARTPNQPAGAGGRRPLHPADQSEEGSCPGEGGAGARPV